MRYILLIMLMSFGLVGCTLSPTESEKLESQAGDSSTGGGCLTLQQIFTSPPEHYPEMKKHMVLPDGSAAYYGPVTYLVESVQVKLDGATEQIFEKVGEEQWMKTMLTLFLTLAIMFYGASVLLGIVKGSGIEVVGMIFKFLLVFYLVTDYENFSTFIKDILENTSDYLISVMGSVYSSGAYSGETKFSFADDLVSTILSLPFLKTVIALFSPSVGTGWVYGLIMVMFMWFFVSAMVRAIYVYVLSLIMRAVLFGLAPIFIAFIMFNRTKFLFEGWLKQIIHFSLLPVILFAFLGLFGNLVDYFLSAAGESAVDGVQSQICFDVVSSFPGQIVNLFIPSLGPPGATVEGFDSNIPVGLFPLLALAIITYVMKSMVDWAMALSAQLTAAFTTSRLGGGGSVASQLGLEGLVKNFGNPFGKGGGK